MRDDGRFIGRVDAVFEVDGCFARKEERQPVDADIPTSATPSSSSFSAVAAGSMMDFGPEHTSSPGVRASSNRSALTSGSSPGCTPPIPPVALTTIPALAAAQIVALTVVAPSSLLATASG